VLAVCADRMPEVGDVRRDEEVARFDLVGAVLAFVALGEGLENRRLAYRDATHRRPAEPIGFGHRQSQSLTNGQTQSSRRLWSIFTSDRGVIGDRNVWRVSTGTQCARVITMEGD
jgi:hypothetical protein